MALGLARQWAYWNTTGCILLDPNYLIKLQMCDCYQSQDYSLGTSRNILFSRYILFVHVRRLSGTFVLSIFATFEVTRRLLPARSPRYHPISSAERTI
ncbi:hypothetical protein VTN49DRAFT_2578 [Thermomyces lanuginosus]|uniref:uncharacterized protein n=1 Tax=Thermomyces lanuginosus TaxID=5541 RepID=UPI003742E40D